MIIKNTQVLLVTLFMVVQAFSQVDTVICHAYKTHTAGMYAARKGYKYLVDDKPATKAQYDEAVAAVQANAEIEKTMNCTPCYLKYIDLSGQLVHEGDFYTDCCIGIYIQRYSNGKLRIKGHYKTPKTKTPDYNSGDCRKDGEWIYYTPNGAIEKTEIYKNDILIK